jgi:hypothetical protein
MATATPSARMSFEFSVEIGVAPGNGCQFVRDWEWCQGVLVVIDPRNPFGMAGGSGGGFVSSSGVGLTCCQDPSTAQPDALEERVRRKGVGLLRSG